MLCGDEVGAVVADIGALHSRFGSGGQDAPRHVFHSRAGIDTKNKKTRRYGHGISYYRNVGEDVETEIEALKSPDGAIDYDIVSSIIDHGVSHCMNIESQYFPIMMIDNMFTSNEDKYKLMQIFFEEFNFTATYFPSAAMLGAFCYGRQTGLVVDLGASHTTVSPVVDGYVLEKSVVSSSRGGDWIDREILDVLCRHDITVRPWYERNDFPIQSVKSLSSFRQFHVQEVIRDLKHWMCFVSAKSILGDGATQPHPRVPYMPAYELPDGTPVTASDDLCLVSEKLFSAGRTRVTPAPQNSSQGASSSQTAPAAGKAAILSSSLLRGVPTHAQPIDIDGKLDPLHELIFASIAKCDCDCRKEMVSNIMLTGGGSLMDGLQTRLNTELVSLLPAQLKPKILTKLPVEQMFASWIGGSILSICGTFQQMWLSREEYLENGPAPALARRRG